MLSRAPRTGGTRNYVNREHARRVGSKLRKLGFFAKSRGQPTPDAPPARRTPHRRAKSCSLLPFFRCRSLERRLGRVWTPPAADRPASLDFLCAGDGKRPAAAPSPTPRPPAGTAGNPARASPPLGRLPAAGRPVRTRDRTRDRDRPFPGHRLRATGYGLPTTGYRRPFVLVVVLVLVVGCFPAVSCPTLATRHPTPAQPPAASDRLPATGDREPAPGGSDRRGGREPKGAREPSLACVISHLSLGI